LKTVSFAGFKIKVLTSRLIPATRIYAFTSPRHAKDFIAILESLDKLISANRVKLIVRKPKGRIIRPS